DLRVLSLQKLSTIEGEHLMVTCKPHRVYARRPSRWNLQTLIHALINESQRVINMCIAHIYIKLQIDKMRLCNNKYHKYLYINIKLLVQLKKIKKTLNIFNFTAKYLNKCIEFTSKNQPIVRQLVIVLFKVLIDKVIRGRIFYPIGADIPLAELKWVFIFFCGVLIIVTSISFETSCESFCVIDDIAWDLKLLVDEFLCVTVVEITADFICSYLSCSLVEIDVSKSSLIISQSFCISSSKVIISIKLTGGFLFSSLSLATTTNFSLL
ncbi:hypothetical protein AGLY_009111, partial [Aphis glycines]